MNQPDQAGQETAAPAQFHVHPVAALTEANALVGFLQNRNLLLAHDLLNLKGENDGYRQRINSLVEQVLSLEAQIKELTTTATPEPGEEA